MYCFVILITVRIGGGPAVGVPEPEIGGIGIDVGMLSGLGAAAGNTVYFISMRIKNSRPALCSFIIT